MVVITKEGHFEKGAWIKGLHPSMIGKKIIHVGRCVTPYGYDGSYCTEMGKGGAQNPMYQWVILHGINPDGSLVIEWDPRNFPGKLSTLEPYWNDGNWDLLENVIS